MDSYTYSATVHEPVESLRPRIEAALRAEGFGILTEIDVSATLKAKLDVDRAPFLILGACNPRLADRALSLDPSVGALLPCNVVLRQGEREDESVIEIMDPRAALGIAGAAIRPVAEEAAQRLQRALGAILETAVQ